uniref:Uncharacterized protein n=1 Tax=Talaromyces marneffei PM1 TaxID=1077442 RepID=A0A093VFL7_TALMA
MTKASVSRDAGIAYLDEEISQDYEGDENGTTPQEAAQQIDAFYAGDFLFSQPIFQKEKAKGMINFLGGLDALICGLGRILRYDDCRQDALVQMLLELHKLPPRQVKIWDERCDDYLNYSAFLARCTGAGLYKNGKTIQGINTVRMESLKDLRRICHTGTYGNPGY